MSQRRNNFNHHRTYKPKSKWMPKNNIKNKPNVANINNINNNNQNSNTINNLNYVVDQINTNDQKINNSNNINNQEINASQTTMMYCPPTATKSSDIIFIAPNQVIPVKADNCLRIICLGCTHELHNQLYYPFGDLLIHCGDISNWRRYYHTEKIYPTSKHVWKDFIKLINTIKVNNNYKYGIYVSPGNHDVYCEQNTNYIRKLLNKNNINLLINQTKIINIFNTQTQSVRPQQLTLFSSPISFYRNKPSNAFQVHRKGHKDLWNKDKRNGIKYWDYEYINKYFYKNKKAKLNILVCHGPPKGYGDCNLYGRASGSDSLLKYIESYKPKIFICSDFHGSVKCHNTKNSLQTHGYGIHFLKFNSMNTNQFCIMVNTAICHTKARFMKQVRRGCTILDIKIDQLCNNIST